MTDPISGIIFMDCVHWDVFVLDRTTGAMTLESTGVGGAPSGGSFPTISGDGTHIAYMATAADNVIPGDSSSTSSAADFYVKDLTTGAVQKATVNSAGENMQGNGADPWARSLTTDGRYFSFVARVCNLGVTCDATGHGPSEVYVRDLVAQTTQIASVDNSGNPVSGFGVTGPASISANGRFVMFSSPDPALMTDCTRSFEDNVFIRDRTAATTTRVGRSFIDGDCTVADMGQGPSITPDGRYVVFESSATDIIPDHMENTIDVYMDRRW